MFLAYKDLFMLRDDEAIPLLSPSPLTLPSVYVCVTAADEGLHEMQGAGCSGTGPC